MAFVNLQINQPHIGSQDKGGPYFADLAYRKIIVRKGTEDNVKNNGNFLTLSS